MKKIQLVAIISGVITFFLVLSVVKNMQEPVVEEIERERIVVAATDIIPYTEISADMLSIKEIDVNSIHPGAIREKEEAVGKISNTTIFAEEPILLAKIDQKESITAGLALKISPGKRAISIMVEVDTGVGNNLRVGNWVDMMAVFPSDFPEDVLRKYNNWAIEYPEYFNFLANSSAQSSQNDSQKNEVVGFAAETVPKAMMLLQDIKVISLDRTFLGDYDAVLNMENYASVTLEVTPEQAMMINLAEDYHKVRLILRNQTDHDILEIDGITLQDLMQEETEEE